MDIAMDESAGVNPTRLKGGMIVCWILGLGNLLAWNCMLTIGDYYYQLFPKYHPSRVLALVYQPFSIATIAILSYKSEEIDRRKRNLVGYLLFTLGTSSLLLIDFATSGKGGLGVYIGICIIVASFGVASAHVEGGIVGEISSMSPKLIQSFFAGIAASGALTSGLRLVTKAAFELSSHNLRKGVILFLTITTLLELLCFILYAFIFPKLPIVKYHRSKAAALERSPSETTCNRISKKELFKENIDYALDLYLIYALTLSIFPGFLYENTIGSHKLGSWYPNVLVAVFNVWDLISRYIPLVKRMTLKSRKGLMIATLSRFLLVPCFYFTARYGEEGWMIMLVSILGLTNGYLTVSVLTAAPKGYKGVEANALGNMLVSCLLTGVFSGAALDWLWLIGNSDF
ncbi:unnamed protein product [Cuscuta epithymum]|uniref:Equilibrative nucleoside transporter n=1 Tax=Cuscuta epithymum TaxID=186058 RepID=A0AAV0EJE5_9ASTE|nr:unnamed protein product [Cuscuta epithymum]